ncbi:MAG: DUF4394 domain-containing protein [Tepidisphaeraceae bacterium]
MPTWAVPGQFVGYGVGSDGDLFRFDPDAPAAATTVGFVSPVPEAIDFRPGTSTLYAIDVGETTTQLYTIDTSTAVATPVGPGFPTTVAGSYDLSGNQRFGFDFNPTTLQVDNSMRIRLTSTNGVNMRLNSSTGLPVLPPDVPLSIAPSGNSPFVDGSAYTNSATSKSGGTTTLYDMDSRSDALYTQNPPNNGTLNFVGNFGVTVDAGAGIGFDIASTDPNDDSLLDEHAFAAFARPSEQLGYLLYDVNLTTGATTGGRAVGGGLGFTGGLAVTVAPEPAMLGLLGAGALLVLKRRR